MRNTSSVFIAVLILILVPLQTKAQNSTPIKQSLDAFRVVSDADIAIDGVLSEEAWELAPVATDFTQRSPLDGAKPSQKTEVRILYTNKYLYIGAIAYDTAPDSINAPLFRRDGSEISDWFYVNIDSYNDNRTAFTFAVNPRSVQKDILYFNDNQEDILWDAVWDASTRITEEGWVAEFRIPISQLRFTSSTDIQNWGINFQRRIARYEEINFWSPTPREEFGLVSWFGDLNGIENLEQPLRLELLPYVSSSLTRDATFDTESPYYEENEFQFKAGGDIKYGLTSDFTLTATVNPDFGQVEADPATINLTQFELFFEERRPFFLEGSDIFSFGTTNSQNTYSTHTNFYSRRIGRTPFATDENIFGIDNYNNQGAVNFDYTSRPNETTIGGAGKVSGKTEGGLSIGILDAYTVEETGSFVDSDLGVNGNYLVEPATNYFVGRIQQDIKDGDAQIGGFVSSVNRNLGGTYIENYIHESAYQLGIDGEYNWANRNWGASGVFSYSSVNGTQEALVRTQESPARYYNRVDSDGLSVDSSLTSLGGYFGEFSIGKYSGPGLRYSLTYSEMSPGYEINDMGFLERADYRAPHYYVEYLNADPDFFRFYLLWGYAGQAWNFDGDKIFSYYASGAYFQFRNLWTVIMTGGFTGTFYNDRITRGGPLMRRPKSWNTSLDITSNTTKDFYATFSNRYRKDASGEYQITFETDFSLRPTTYIQLSFVPGYIKSKDTDQYQGFFNIDADPESDYLFSDINLDLVYTEMRINWTFSPTISLQTFLRPYYYTADFTNYKTFEQARTYNFSPIDAATNQFYDQNNDLEFKAVQGNAVLRWEYRPGSTLYLVWQQDRSSFIYKTADFQPINGTLDTFSKDPINIFLVKLSYWFGS